MSDLLDAVDALTKEIRTKVIQEISGELGATKTTTVKLPSLLDQLENTIRDSMGLGSSGSLASERNVLNADALHQAILITGMVKEWARNAGIQTRPGDLPGQLLRAWYVVFAAKAHEDAVEEFHVKTLHRWAAKIEAMFDPPRTRDLPDDCPTCGAKTWWLNGEEYPRPLIITFHDGPDMIRLGKGLCRACETAFGLRELSFAINEADTIRHAATTVA